MALGGAGLLTVIYSSWRTSATPDPPVASAPTPAEGPSAPNGSAPTTTAPTTDLTPVPSARASATTLPKTPVRTLPATPAQQVVATSGGAEVEPAESRASGAERDAPPRTPQLQSRVVATPPPAEAEASPPAPAPPVKGTLSLLIEPWASVSIDGKKIGDTPLRPVNLEAGQHTVTLSHPAFVDLPKVITVKPGEVTVLAVDLAREAFRKRK